MSSRDLEELADGSTDPSEKLGPELVVQLVRALRIVSVHNMDNETSRLVTRELRDVVNRALEELQSVQITCVADNVYFNNEFVKLKGAAFDASIQIKKLYQKLAINEISFNATLELAHVTAFLRSFQDAILGPTPADFANAKFPAISVRSIKQTKSIGIDRRLDVARTYAQLVVSMQEALALLASGKVSELAHLRRAVQQLADAARGQESLLVGLTRFDNTGGDIAVHAAAVTAIVLLQGIRLGLPKPQLMSLAMSALFHDIGRARIEAEKRTVTALARDVPRRRMALRTALDIAQLTRSKEVMERAAVSFEHTLPAAGDREGIIPGMGARMIAVACTFDRLTQPDAKAKPMRPEEAMRMLLDHSGAHFDRRAVKLFTSIVGLYPVGSLVKLSGGQTAIVLSVPEDPAKASKPTVKVVREGSIDADYVLELDRDDAGVEIVGGVDARGENLNVTHFLLA